MPGQNGARSNIQEFHHVGNIPAIFSRTRRMNIKHVYKINVWSKFQVLLSKFHFAAQFRVCALRRAHGAIAQKRIAAGQSNSSWPIKFKSWKRIAAGQSNSNRGSQKTIETEWRMQTVKLEVRGGN